MTDELCGPELWNQQRIRRDLAASETLFRDAQIDRWTRMSSAKALTDEERRVGVENFKRFMAHEQGMTRTKLARMAGVGASTLAELLNGKYRGDVDKLIRRLDGAINEFLRRTDAPGSGQFIKTHVAKRIFAILKTTAKMRTMGALYGCSGLGKTMALEAAVGLDFPSAILVKVNPGCTSPVNFCHELLRQIVRPRGIPDTLRTRAAAFNAIVGRLDGSDRLLLIDEADGLQIETLNLIRHIHDATGCPVLLCGRPNLARKINRTMRSEEIGGSLRGRLGVEYDLMAGCGAGGKGGRWLFSLAEVADVLAKFRVKFTKDAANWLAMLANITAFDGGREAGGLRHAVKVFTLAILLAQHQRNQTVTLDLVKQASGLTRDEDYAAEIGRSIDEALKTKRA